MNNGVLDYSAVVTVSESNSSTSGQGSSKGSSENGQFSERGSSGFGGSNVGSSENGSSESKGSGDNCDTPDDASDKKRQVRKMRRVMANRRSARESRERRKKLLTDLEQAVNKLSSENTKIAENNLAMRQELMELLQKSGLAASLSI